MKLLCEEVTASTEVNFIALVVSAIIKVEDSTTLHIISDLAPAMFVKADSNKLLQILKCASPSTHVGKSDFF